LVDGWYGRGAGIANSDLLTINCYRHQWCKNSLKGPFGRGGPDFSGSSTVSIPVKHCPSGSGYSEPAYLPL
jgi:hypothetical protein